MKTVDEGKYCLCWVIMYFTMQIVPKKTIRKIIVRFEELFEGNNENCVFFNSTELCVLSKNLLKN